MAIQKKKSSSKTELFWNRFEQTGSIQAYLRFHAARQDRAEGVKKAVPQAKAASKAR